MPLHRPSTISRDWYNTLKGLAMSRIVAYEDAAERGQYADLQWLWRLMEQTDVTVQAAIARRLSFIDRTMRVFSTDRVPECTATTRSNDPFSPRIAPSVRSCSDPAYMTLCIAYKADATTLRSLGSA
jgi:hypothetical protein